MKTCTGQRAGELGRMQTVSRPLCACVRVTLVLSTVWQVLTILALFSHGGLIIADGDVVSFSVSLDAEAREVEQVIPCRYRQPRGTKGLARVLWPQPGRPACLTQDAISTPCNLGVFLRCRFGCITGVE